MIIGEIAAYFEQFLRTSKVVPGLGGEVYAW
jgi:hypothetical protein